MNKNSITNKQKPMLYNADASTDSCGVGFITHKRNKQTHDVLNKAYEALCSIPHRGGMSAEGVGDGAGVNIDLSLNFFRKITENSNLELGDFGVANFFFPKDHNHYDSAAQSLVNEHLQQFDLPIIKWRNIPVDNSVLNDASIDAHYPIKQVVFGRPAKLKDASHAKFEHYIQGVLLTIEKEGFTRHELDGFYPLSMSSYTQVYKGRLTSCEVIPYFIDLYDEEHKISTLFFHTRFSTNTAPATMMAQPFRYIAHNGELNTDKKNRLSEQAIARQHNKHLVFPLGQSDSSRLDQTLSRRIHEDNLNLITAILAMMPPAWENDSTLTADVRAMLEYFSLYEEKNDGPAAIIFNDGIRVGARLDRLGLRPLRTIETNDYLTVMSEAGQIDFPSKEVLKRGRIKAGGMLYFDHSTGKSYNSQQVMTRLAKEIDYQSLLTAKAIHLDDLPKVELNSLENQREFSTDQQHTAYSLNQESFKFLLDPMLNTGLEKISAMGYGLAPNSLAAAEGGMSRYFSQRFAQVTNPPLDSLRESDGMTLRVALGAKPNFSNEKSQQLVINSPILQRTQLEQVRQQKAVSTITIDALYTPAKDPVQNEKNLQSALETTCKQVFLAAEKNTGIIILSDINISKNKAALPALLLISAANQTLVKEGLRFNSSLISETGQAVSAHDVATILGFGASAICLLSVHNRVLSEFTADKQQTALDNFQKAVAKSLMKIMGKFGLCTAESYIGGEFFESNYIDTDEPRLKDYFPNIHSSVGGIRFTDIAASATEWHNKSLAIKSESDIPFLGLFKERHEGAGHTFGNVSVHAYINMTNEAILYIDSEKSPAVSDTAYTDFGYEKRSPEQIDAFGITPAYRNFSDALAVERNNRPAALRDVMSYPADISRAQETAEFDQLLEKQDLVGNNNFCIRGLMVKQEESSFTVSFSHDNHKTRLNNLAAHFENRFVQKSIMLTVNDSDITVRINDDCTLCDYLEHVITARDAISLKKVQAAHKIIATLATGAMSHGALLAEAHEAVAQGTNIAGAISNSGEGGEHSSRYNTLKSSKVKQFASGRFGVWAGYLADLNIEEIEIKIAQGAKPGEGGQLPAMKVSVEIAAARGGTPKVELISPPPHHDTYSIEDLGQLIHDAKAARVKVTVKLVSSEGIGTIAVGVAKAGADVINVAGNTGGTGAAAVTSLKNTGRSSEIGISEVHQALSVNGLRDKVVLRCSAAHQNGSDVIKSAILGADSFEFGTTALMMLRCVMAKNCNVRCPAGLTTSHEEFKGDPRILAQYFMNLAHEVREILAALGYKSLSDIRGETHLLHLITHDCMVGQMNFDKLLQSVKVVKIENPIYLEADFSIDDKIIEQFKSGIINGKQKQIIIEGPDFKLNNRRKTVGGQVAIDIERILSYQLSADKIATNPAIYSNQHKRNYLAPDSLIVRTTGSAGQSYAAFNNDGMRLEHTGTCNDGVGKTACGGTIIIKSPGGGHKVPGENVLIGNFALFGATGGKTFINGEAGDRFAVRNSGAMAVVEGVGDFACEYMTNGAVLNLGSFGKGLCNGMSGGNTYQYDPENKLEKLSDTSSVEIRQLTEDSDTARAHEQFVLSMLEQHIEYAESSIATNLLANWQVERKHFKFSIPLWLYKTQTAEFIAKSLDRKVIIEELSVNEAQKKMTLVQQAYANGTALFNGKAPSFGEFDSPLALHLINSFAVLNKATIIAANQTKNVVKMEQIAQTLIMNKAKPLQDALVKETRAAYDNYDDAQLAILLANKRLEDYKQALILRDVQSIYSIGSTHWIIDQSAINTHALKDIPTVDTYLANLNSQSVIQNMMKATEDA
jgi:glutamate synthase (NADPH/NADH) large chain